MSLVGRNTCGEFESFVQLATKYSTKMRPGAARTTLDNIKVIKVIIKMPLFLMQNGKVVCQFPLAVKEE